jgi:hypothetical protein
MLQTYFLIALFIGVISQLIVYASGRRPTMIALVIDGVLWPLTLCGMIKMYFTDKDS